MRRLIDARLRVGLAVAVVAALLVVGCSDDDDDSGEMVRTGPVPVETNDKGRLTAEPSPITLAEVGRLPADSPQRVVMQLLFAVQWGHLPATPDAYHPRIVRGLTRTRIVDSFSFLSPTFTSTRPAIRDQTREGDSAFLTLELLTTRFAPSRETFVLRRSGGAWKIVYDTLLARSLSGYVTSSRSPNPAKPTFAARRAGAAAAREYRLLGAEVADAKLP